MGVASTGSHRGGERRQPTVLVVEDESTIRHAVADALADAGCAVRACADHAAASACLEQGVPDVAVVDVRLSGDAGQREGFALGRRLRELSDAPLLFLTAADDLDSRLEGFRIGGDDYLVKPFAIAELVARVQALLRRSGKAGDEVLRVGDVLIDRSARLVMRGDTVDLTYTEFELLYVLARSSNRVCSKRQLLLDVWGAGYHDVNLVETCVSSLRRKLDANGPRVIHTVRGAGYVMRS